jgi:hypothetical protein
LGEAPDEWEKEAAKDVLWQPDVASAKFPESRAGHKISGP